MKQWKQDILDGEQRSGIRNVYSRRQFNLALRAGATQSEQAIWNQVSRMTTHLKHLRNNTRQDLLDQTESNIEATWKSALPESFRTYYSTKTMTMATKTMTMARGIFAYFVLHVGIAAQTDIQDVFDVMKTIQDIYIPDLIETNQERLKQEFTTRDHWIELSIMIEQSKEKQIKRELGLLQQKEEQIKRELGLLQQELGLLQQKTTLRQQIASLQKKGHSLNDTQISQLIEAKDKLMNLQKPSSTIARTSPLPSSTIASSSLQLEPHLTLPIALREHYHEKNEHIEHALTTLQPPTYPALVRTVLYGTKGSPVIARIMTKRALELANTFDVFHKSRGDGNCGYRAIFYTLLFSLLCNTNVDSTYRKKELNKVIAKFEAVKFSSKDDSVSPHGINVSDARDRLVARLKHIKAGGMNWLDDSSANSFSESFSLDDDKTIGHITGEELMRAFNDDRKQETDYIGLRLLRKLAYICVQGNTISGQGLTFEQVLEGDTTMEERLDYIFRNNTEIDHMILLALAQALEMPISVWDLNNRNRADKGADVHYGQSVSEGSTPTVPLLNVLYRHGHYDIVISTQFTNQPFQINSQADEQLTTIALILDWLPQKSS